MRGATTRSHSPGRSEPAVLPVRESQACRRALVADEPVHVKLAIEVVGLMLQAPCQQTSTMHRHRVAKLIEAFDGSGGPAGSGVREPHHRETPFVAVDPIRFARVVRVATTEARDPGVADYPDSFAGSGLVLVVVVDPAVVDEQAQRHTDLV